MSSSLQYVPFESVWKMRIDHPYSLFVRDGSHFWSCGQCPLNEAGDVLHPNDLFAQARALTGIIDQLLGKIGANRSAVAQLVVYYIKTADGDGHRLTHLLSGFFDTHVLVVPVSIPHFYYDGMMIEVDVKGAVGEKASRLTTDESTRSSLQIVDIGDLSYGVLLVPSEAELDSAVQRLLARSDMADRIISEQWFVASDAAAKELRSIRGDRLPTSCEVVGIQRDGFAVIGQFTFARDPVSVTSSSHREHGVEDVAVSLSRSGDFFEVMAACTSGQHGLVEETRRIMRAIDWTLRDHNLSFKDVRKSTTHYIAGSSAEDLHDNMSVRNAYYTKPGPGSTGLPVLSFPLAASRVSVRIFGKLSAR
ncbi:uncharacterized protein AB675_9380 [Cyphellophora attinorum]|uniref:Uncharacterized protein n=1 Tax=Cyphellophora attinorum TaxID=1664694 RepID=A0A0N1HSI9_9EURO|nr:uncharacterized protein AB675_9380 [Phialophora attinorum]KPI41600.1 hypothetical protein AB675_9380 [Phialophora attinorum]